MQQLVLSIDDEELLSRLEGEAQRQGKPLQDLVLEALHWWMRAMEVAQDLTDSEIALEEYELEGGIDAFEYFRQRARSAPLQGWHRASGKEIAGRLRGADLARLRVSIEALGKDPRARGCRKLAAEKDFYRIRVGNYRVIYVINDEDSVVVITKVARRTTTTYR
jgi:mRNA interferase RelE/StbE